MTVVRLLFFTTAPSAMITLGVPYAPEDVETAEADARAQARAVIDEIIEQDGPEAVGDGWETKKVVALVAYLQRLGTDL